MVEELHSIEELPAHRFDLAPRSKQLFFDTYPDECSLSRGASVCGVSGMVRARVRFRVMYASSLFRRV